jgi:hypothetical protein
MSYMGDDSVARLGAAVTVAAIVGLTFATRRRIGRVDQRMDAIRDHAIELAATPPNMPPPTGSHLELLTTHRDTGNDCPAEAASRAPRRWRWRRCG